MKKNNTDQLVRVGVLKNFNVLIVLFSKQTLLKNKSQE